MIERVHEITLKYIESVAKSQRKEIGQFFTQPSIARFMAELMEYNNEKIRILDAGAGSGILTAALCHKCLSNNYIKNIHVELYENNQNILPVLKENMEFLREEMQKHSKNFTYNIIEENFILANADYWNNREERSCNELYDVVISNPPYKKIPKLALEAIAMENVVYGQPNIYFLFMAMSAKLLKDEGQLIFITPRSFTSGAYFRSFRKWFLKTTYLTNIHLFQSRNDVFNTDSILQETLILKAIKSNKSIDNVTITTSPDATFSTIDMIEVPMNTIIDKNTDNLYILIPTTVEEIEVMSLINSWTYTMPQLGFKLSTGKVVDFRATEFLNNKPEGNTALFWACNFNNNKIIHPVNDLKSQQYIMDNKDSRSILMDNKNYIFVKRFTSKEETKRIQCALYFAGEYEKYRRIGVENHLNYITKLHGEFSLEELYGLFAILNSTYVDKYYRILNGSTQVNASEMNSIPMPPIEIIKEIGSRVLQYSNCTVEFCNKIIKDIFINDKKMHEYWEGVNGEIGRGKRNINVIRYAKATV